MMCPVMVRAIGMESLARDVAIVSRTRDRMCRVRIESAGARMIPYCWSYWLRLDFRDSMICLRRVTGFSTVIRGP